MTDGVPTFDTASIAGDRVIGVDTASASVYVSNDAGLTWIGTRNVAGLLPAGVTVQPYGVIAGTGPLGYAVVVRTGRATRPTTSTCCTAATARRGRSRISALLARRPTGRCRA